MSTQETQQIMITTPRPGDYWHGQGGIYIGTMLEAEQYVHLVMATQAFRGKFSENYDHIPGEFSRLNGKHNTHLILQAQPDNALCNAIKNHEAEGHSDFYLPSEFENNFICINGRNHVEKVVHWSSTQSSAYHAWAQDFEYGCQLVNFKGNVRAARAVRRILAN